MDGEERRGRTTREVNLRAIYQRKSSVNVFPKRILILRKTLFTCFTWNGMMSSLLKNHGVFKSNVFSHCFPRKRKSTYRNSVSA
jgi:hypothetical protein